jgi:hypothetical protein
MLAATARGAAAAPTPGTITIPTPTITIVREQHNSRGVSNLRTMFDFQTITNRNINPVGLTPLRASASSDFNKQGLKTVLQRIDSVCARNELTNPPVLVLDLREESHGYFNNGELFSWMTEHDWGNKGLTQEQALVRESFLLAEMPLLGQAMYCDDPSYKSDRVTLRPLIVTNTMTEKQLVEQAGVRYARIPVTDNLRPSDHNVDQFIQLARQLPSNTWIHFHCKAGTGRAMTFAIMWDILHNGDQLVLADITRRQAQLLDGVTDLLRVNPRSAEWERKAGQERADFLRTFYEYAKTKPLESKAPMWTDWLKSRQAR